MNVVLIISDTLRRDHLGFYGNKAMHTPNLDRLAEESVVFDRAYSCSFPTLPCRAEMFTGKFVFPYLNWGPIPSKDPLLSETLAKAGYTCAMVTDNLPLCRPGYGYDRGFHARHRVRGQWYDNFQPESREFTWPCDPKKLRDSADGRINQYFRNVSIRRTEEDYFAPQVVNEACHWLERNHDRSKFFLYVDIFDPHEPWDPPQHYVDLYDPDGSGDNVVYPAYGRADTYSPEDIRRIRALYAGEVTMVDRWVGKLLDTIDALGRREDTVVVFMSDHGILLGERGLLGKMGGKQESLKGWPTYCEVARVPLLFRAPGLKPGRRNGFAHPGDVGPTLLDLTSVKRPDSMTTASLAQVLKGEEERVRDVAVSSWSLRGWSSFRPSVVRTDEWALVFWRSGVEPELYHLPSDPNETNDVYRANRGVAAELHRRYLQFLRENETPRGNYVARKWLVTWGEQSKQSLLLPG